MIFGVYSLATAKANLTLQLSHARVQYVILLFSPKYPAYISFSLSLLLDFKLKFKIFIS